MFTTFMILFLTGVVAGGAFLASSHRWIVAALIGVVSAYMDAPTAGLALVIVMVAVLLHSGVITGNPPQTLSLASLVILLGAAVPAAAIFLASWIVSMLAFEDARPLLGISLKGSVG